MAVSLEKIYYTAMRKYDLKLVAGTAGIWNIVSWIHLVEDVQVVDFLKGQELVVITGISHPGEEQLLEYTKRLYENEASGLIINIGPFIGEIPQKVIEFAEEKGFPLFCLPWEVHLVDFNREFCNLIIHSEQESQNLCSAFRNAIFSPKAEETYVPFLQSEGISLNETYCMIKCMPRIVFEKEGEFDITRTFYDLRLYFERILNKTQKKYVIFRYDNFITMILPATDRKEVDGIIEECQRFGKWWSGKGNLYFSVSKYNLKITDLSEYFETLSYMCKLSEKEGHAVWHWEELGEWNMILSVRSFAQLEEYMNTAIGELMKYDEENGTEYCKILDIYLRLNGNMPEVAAECFIHRNTVAYHLKKIEDILNCDIYSTKDRVKLYLALRIKEIREL